MIQSTTPIEDFLKSSKRWSMCLSKKKFYSAKSAKKVGRYWDQKVYKCPFCSLYHLGSRKD